MKSHFSKPTYVILLAGLALLLVLVYRYFAPFGKEIKYSFVNTLPGSEKINSITSSNSEPMHLDSQLIKTKISRFTIQANPKTVGSINVNFRFKPGQNEIKLGFRGDEKQAFSYQPLYLASLQNLGWKSVSENGLTLYQKNSTFANVADFVKAPPKDKKIAIYQVDKNILSPVGSKDTGKTLIATPLRGSHTLYVQVVSAPLIIKIAKQDFNMYPGADKLKISLYSGEKNVAEKTIGDDGITDKSTLKTLPTETELKVDSINPGTYRLELVNISEGSDFQITKIDVNQKKVVVANNIFFTGAKSTDIYTNASKITAQTVHDDSLQTLKLNNSVDMPLKKTSEKYSFDLTKLVSNDKNGLSHIYSPKSDVVLNADGYFSFSPDSFFNPSSISTVNLADFADSGDIDKNVDYILTSLPPVKLDNGWLNSTVNVDPKNINLTSNSIYFSLEIPDLDKHGGSLEIGTFDITVNDKTSQPTPTAVPTAKPTVTPTPVSTKSAAPKVSLLTLIKMIFSGLTQNSHQASQSKPTVKPTPTIIPTPTQVPSGNCSLNGKILSVGSTFAAADECNFCTCAGNLQIECTSKDCSQK